jgi:hypothetical protein
MGPKAQQDALTTFVNSLSSEIHEALDAKGLDIVIEVMNICSAREWVLYETGGVCEGVRMILRGRAAPTALPELISKDSRIEEEHRAHIPEVAYDIQTKVFDSALPILKHAGFPIKEGRVPAPPQKPVESPYAPVPSPLSPAGSPRPLGVPEEPDSPTVPPSGGAPRPEGTEDKYVRALSRIASGTRYGEQELMNAFEDLPQGLRQAIGSVDTANAVQTIAKKHLLHVDQMSSLASETGLVLLGLTHPADFIANLGKRLRVQDDKAREIAKEISAEILSKVREALRTLHETPPQTQTPLAPSPVRPSPSVPAPTQPRANVTAQATPPAQKHELLSNQSSPLQKMSTPYTPDAAWKTGLAPTSSPASKPAYAVGPTGWRPGQGSVRPAAPASSVAATPVPRPPETAQVPVPPHVQPPVAVALPQAPTRSAGDAKMRPSSESATPLPQKTTPTPEDFLEEKMSAPVGIPHEEKKFTVDPYREPIG